MKNKLIQQLQILMKQQGMMDYKADFYASYGVSSSKDMSESELQDAIRRLGGKPTMCREKANANTRYMRSEVLKVDIPTKLTLSCQSKLTPLKKFS